MHRIIDPDRRDVRSLFPGFLVCDNRIILIPRFSLRGLLIIIGVCGGIFAVLPFAVQGEAWALAITITFVSALSVALAFAALYLVTWFVGLVVSGVRGSNVPESPFAEHTPPPQIIEPEEPV